MNKSVLNAFSYMFKESDWKFKILILFGLNVPAIMLQGILMSGSELITILTSSAGLIVLLLIITLFTTGSAFGYGYKTMQNLSNNTGSILPEWEDNFFQYLKYFGLFAVAMLLFSLVMIIPSLLIIPAIIAGFITPALIAIFVKDFNATSMLAWKKAFALIKQDSGLYIKVFIMYIGLIILSNVFSMIFMFLVKSSLYLAVLLYSLVVAYCQLINAYIIGILGQNLPNNNQLEEIPAILQ